MFVSTVRVYKITAKKNINEEKEKVIKNIFTYKKDKIQINVGRIYFALMSCIHDFLIKK
jgi:hypothetical protein